MKVGVNGAVRDISDLKVGVNGAVRAVSEAYIGVNGAVKKVWPLIPIGYQVILDTVGSGEWECPVSGNWHIELHGGGGRGGTFDFVAYNAGGGGGGSGEEYETTLNVGQKVSYSVGGATTSSGDTTTFGKYSIQGGSTTWDCQGAAGYGSLATSGKNGANRPGKGGYGNKNKPLQTYGNGGDGADIATDPGDGKDGAIILTYLG